MHSLERGKGRLGLKINPLSTPICTDTNGFDIKSQKLKVIFDIMSTGILCVNLRVNIYRKFIFYSF